MIIQLDPRKWFPRKPQKVTLTTSATAPIAPQMISTAIVAPPETATPAATAAQEKPMAITFKSIGHAIATFYKAAVAEIPKIEATKSEVEGVTSAVLGQKYGPLAVGVEDAGYALLGEVSSVLLAGGAAAEAKLADAGLDANVIATVKAVAAGSVSLATVVKAL